jgi:PAS domain S-box-containing protein
MQQEPIRELSYLLLEQKLLTRYEECPICGSTERCSFAIDYRSDRYLAALAASLKIPEESLFHCLEGQKCRSCGATYFDPWFTFRVQRQMYEESHPQHNFGWDLFWSIVNDPVPSDLSSRSELYRRFKETIPNLTTYGELGCPFTGLLPHLAIKQYQYGAKRFWDYPGTYKFNGLPGPHPQVRGRLSLERMTNAVGQWLNQLQLLRTFQWKRLLKRALVRCGLAREIQNDSLEHYFIRCGSSMLWGRGCKSLGLDCMTALEKVFCTPITTFGDIRAEKLHFDLIGIYNALDHYKDPIELLRQVFEFTNYVYLEGHHREASNGKQHLYFLEPSTIRQLPNLLKVAEVVTDFKNSVTEHHYSVLLKKIQPPFTEQPELVGREHDYIFEFVNDSVMSRTLEGRINFWNRRAEEFYGWRKEDAVGRVSHDLLQTQFPKPLEEIESELVRNGLWEGKLVHTTRDGGRVVVESRWILNRQRPSGGVVEINVRSTDLTTQRHSAFLPLF